MMPDKDVKILVVDDSASMRKIVINSLKELGYTNVIEADGGFEAIERLSEGSIGFVLTDWNMPDLAGIDLLKEIRRKATLHQLPVMMITAEATKECVLAAVKAGVNNFIIKPFTTQILEAKIEQVYSRLAK